MDEKNKCIGPCFPKKNLYYNPITLQPIIEKNNSTCPIEPFVKDDELISHKKCDEPSENYKNYDMFNEFSKIASTPKHFLLQIYNIDNYNTMTHFIKNDIEFLPLYTQKRIINAIFLAYKTNTEFPHSLYIKNFVELFKKIYNINLNFNKTTKKISKYKNNDNIDDIFNYVKSKII